MHSILYWIIYFIVTVIVAWVALSLLLIWAKPAFYNSDGSVNWGTTFWVAIVVILLAWVILLIISWILWAIRGYTGSCVPECVPNY